MNRLSWLLVSLMALVFLIVAASVWAMTQPRFATPATRWAIKHFTGQDAQLERARLTVFPVGYQLRALEIEGEITPYRLGALDMTFNLAGIFPGIALISEARVADGRAGIQLKGDDRGEGGDFLDSLDEIARMEAENFVFILSRDGETAEFTITKAAGRPAGGKLEAAGYGGGTEIFFDGRIAGPRVDGLGGAVTLRGDNLSDFANLLGLAAPDTPPYEINGQLSAGKNLWWLDGMAGMVGDSDLGGDLSVHLGRDRPLIDADLHSESLDFDDLGILVGAPTQVESENANDLQREVTQAYAQSDRLMPDATLDLTRIRKVDAHVDFQADSVRAGAVPLKAVSFEMTLEAGVMVFDPIRFQAEAGALDGRISIDASRDIPEHAASGKLSDIALCQFAGGRFARGDLEGGFDLTAKGDGFRAAASSLNGHLSVYTQDGQMRAIGAEAAGLDIGQALGLLLTEEADDPAFFALRCGVARFDVQNGAAIANPVVFDSTDSLIILTGDADLGDESLDLRIESDAKDFSWGSLLGDPLIRGTFRNPRIGVDAGETALQAGVAALLGSLTGALAALPFIEPGDGKDADCGALLARAQATASEAQ